MWENTRYKVKDLRRKKIFAQKKNVKKKQKQ